MAIKSHNLMNIFYSVKEKLAEAVLYLIGFLFVRLYLAGLFVLNAANWLMAYYVNKNVSQDLIVLHYNVNLGVNLIGDVSDIYIIPTLGLTFIIVNFLLLLNTYRYSKFLIHLLLGFTLLINLFLIASTISIYLVNFR